MIGASAAGWADRVVTVPRGDKVRDGAFQLVTLFDRGSERFDHRFTVGFGQAYEIELSSTAGSTGPARGTLGFSYNFLPAFIDLSPALTFGVDDLADQLPGGPSFWATALFRLSLDGDYNYDVPLEFTLGAGTGRYRGLFLAVNLPVSDQFRLVGEQRGRDLTAGLEIRPTRGLTIQWLHRRSGPLFGLSYTTRR